ncbi:MAG TPA: tetratricopeptide repeat protein [Actinomycetota bacterium]|nr:tetratricopeptide repeat protein [Actinomycetota bacterium]
MDLGDRIRDLRLARGLSQKQLAAPHYTGAHVSTIESGRRRPSDAALEHFAAKLGVGVDELRTGRSPSLRPSLELRLHEARVAISSGELERAGDAVAEVRDAARRHDVPVVEAKAEEITGLLCERRGEPEAALEHYERAERLLRCEPPTAVVDAVAGRARCLQALGDIRHAVYVLEAARDALERAGLVDPEAVARVDASLVDAYLDAGLAHDAERAAGRALELLPEVSDPLRLAQMHMNVARLLLHRGRPDDARRSLGRAEDLFRHLELKSETGAARLARGLVLSRQGHLADARVELERARIVFAESRDRSDEARALNELARVERLEGRVERARELLEAAIALVEDGDAPTLAWAHRELGAVLAGSNPVAAEKHLRTAVEVYERTEQHAELVTAYGALAELLRARGRVDAALDVYRTAVSVVST